jgi:hypothetical protein
MLECFVVVKDTVQVATERREGRGGEGKPFQVRGSRNHPRTKGRFWELDGHVSKSDDVIVIIHVIVHVIFLFAFSSWSSLLSCLQSHVGKNSEAC